MDRQVETKDRHQKCEQQKMTDREKERQKELVKEKEQEKEEKQQLKREINVLEEKAKRLKDGEISKEYTYVTLLRKFVKSTREQQ